MRRLFVFTLGSAVILSAILVPHSSLSQVLTLDSLLTISTPATFDSILILAGGQLVADAQITVLGNLTILSGGSVTHTLWVEAGLVLNVADTLDVQAGGLIDVKAKGLKGGHNGSAFGVAGEAYNELGQIVSGAKGGATSGVAGGSYGGTGYGSSTLPTNAPYGLLEAPVWLGAGGGGGQYSASMGGHGGGRVTIDAGTLIVNGTIRSNGGDGTGAGYQPGAGGSGGSLLLRVGSLSGGGAIEAMGGAGVMTAFTGPSGSAGGGRIAITYDTNTFPEAKILARGGVTTGGYQAPAYYGSAGTIYLKDNAEPNGVLIVDNGTIASPASPLNSTLRSSLVEYKALKIRNQGRLRLTTADVASLTVEQPVMLTGTAALLLASEVTLAVTNATGFDLNVESGSTLTLEAGSTLLANAVRVSGGILDANVDLSFPVGSDFELSSAGRVHILNNSTFSIEFFDATNVRGDTMYLSAGSVLDVASGDAVIGSGVKFIKDGVFGETDKFDDLTILSGGSVTHTLRVEAGLVLNVAGTLDVRAGGLIDVNAKGLKGGRYGSAFGVDGEAYNELGQIVSGANGGSSSDAAGGSYGGTGYGSSARPTNAPYGLLEAPVWLGAGGGGGGNSASKGGHGGGRVTIDAGTLIVNGTIRSNGSAGISIPSGWGNGAGGSGGSLMLRVGSLSGGGVIEATGGAGSSGSIGGAGGGRIAITYNTNTFPEAKILARGGAAGSSAYYGSAGTIYLKDNAESKGVLIVDNGTFASPLATPCISALPELLKLIVRQQGRVLASTIDHFAPLNIWITSNGKLTVDGQLTVDDILVDSLNGIDLSDQLEIIGSIRVEKGGFIRRP